MSIAVQAGYGLLARVAILDFQKERLPPVQVDVVRGHIDHVPPRGAGFGEDPADALEGGDEGRFQAGGARLAQDRDDPGNEDTVAVDDRRRDVELVRDASERFRHYRDRPLGL